MCRMFFDTEKAYRHNMKERRILCACVRSLQGFRGFICVRPWQMILVCWTKLVVTYCDIVQPAEITTPWIQSFRPAFQAQLYKFTMETGVHFISFRCLIIIKCLSFLSCRLYSLLRVLSSEKLSSEFWYILLQRNWTRDQAFLQ
jgi:hypothetical protein